jgi:hypothetical protein
MNAHYENLASPPADAVKQITGGKLKGFSDINPQWRYEALTNEFGLCGVGWKFEIANTFTEPVPATQEMMIFVQVNLYVKDGDQWSEPIPGFGGDFLIIKDKNGIHGNDEGYKMAITDALGSAAKVIGVAADIYRGRMESKYSRPAAPPAPKPQAPKAPRKVESLRAIAAAAKEIGVTNDDIKEVMRRHYNKETSNELTDAQAAEMEQNFVSWVAEVKDDDSKLMEDIPL